MSIASDWSLGVLRYIDNNRVIVGRSGFIRSPGQETTVSQYTMSQVKTKYLDISCSVSIQQCDVKFLGSLHL